MIKGQYATVKIGQNRITIYWPLCKDTKAWASFDSYGEGVPETDGSREVGDSKVLSVGLRDQLVEISSKEQVAVVTMILPKINNNS